MLTKLTARVFMVASCVAVAACGGGEPSVSSRNVTTSLPASSAGPSQTYVGEATTADGRYPITLSVASGTTAGTPECASTPASGERVLPVTLTVANADADRSAPFPPVRIELVDGGRREVKVRGTSGACTFTPRVAQIGPGGQEVFVGATPPIDAAAAPGAAGQIEVHISKNSFSLVAPVP